jgi:hypothetical protein
VLRAVKFQNSRGLTIERPLRNAIENIFIGEKAMRSGKGNRLPAELLEPELGKVPLQSSARNLASRPPRTPANLIEETREIVV